jgi:hypothetical protein
MSGRKLAAAALVCAAFTPAHDVITTPITFSREISRLFYDRCVSCHREGGTAFSLVKYEEARPWAKAIKEEVLERRMPPWGAVKGFADFRNDQGLTQEQIEVIADWVEGGAPEGDPKLLPKVPDLEKPAAGVAPAGVTVEASLTLNTPMTLSGIRAGALAEGATLMVTANKPDGEVAPLLWLYNYKPKFGHPYWFSAPLHLPKGTKIEVSPAQAGSVVLLSAKTKMATDERR